MLWWKELGVATWRANPQGILDNFDNGFVACLELLRHDAPLLHLEVWLVGHNCASFPLSAKKLSAHGPQTAEPITKNGRSIHLADIIHDQEMQTGFK